MLGIVLRNLHADSVWICDVKSELRFLAGDRASLLQLRGNSTLVKLIHSKSKVVDDPNGIPATQRYMASGGTPMSTPLLAQFVQPGGLEVIRRHKWPQFNVSLKHQHPRLDQRGQFGGIR